MNEEYIRYSQSREHQQTSALGRYVQLQTFDILDNYVNQKQQFGMGEMIGFILARSLVKSFEEIIKDIFD